MADDKEIKFTPEQEKAITEATSSQEIADVAARPRDEAGRFVTTEAKPKVEEKKDDAAPTVYKDTVMIGGKPVEFEGKDAADILAQVKVANQAFEMGRAKQEPEKAPEAPKAPFTPEELAALSLKASTGDLKAIEEYMVKSGAIDRYLESKGVKIEQVKSVLESTATNAVKDEWTGAVTEFLANSDWPGGKQNEYLLKTKLAELKDDNGQPLAFSPSAKNLQRAYDALKEAEMLFPVEVKTETKPTTETAKAAPAAASTTTEKRKPAGSTLFGTSQESGTRKSSASAPKAPEILDTDDPQTIMAKFKEAAMANGQSPDDVLKGAYSGRTQ